MIDVKVSSLKKCDATPPTIALINEIAGEMGIEFDFKHIIVETPEQALENRFIGSPTVQINGLDIEPSARQADQFGLT